MRVLQLMPKFGRFFLLLMCVGAAAFAGDKGKIAGNVTDSQTGEPLVGANVEIEGLQTGASTDADGDFFIINIHPGTYTVTCSYIGYKIITYTDILVKAGRTTRMQIKLAPAVIEGQTVTVTADRPIIEKDVTASEQVIGTELLERSWARTVSEALETQTGIFSTVPDAAWERGRNQTLIRGSSSVQALYQLDNLSVNSGLMSDNYTGFNTSTIQEISVLTGGYNAEYGDARTAIINVVSKESAEGVKGTLLSRFRPAGKYHFGPNFYSTSNYDYQHFDLEYWTAESQNNNSEFFGENPEELLSRWRQQITPNDTLGNYAERPEYELEGTLFGGLNEQLSFLASARYKHGVGIFPQAIPYNPEFNFQGYLNYNISTSLKLRIGRVFRRLGKLRLSFCEYEHAGICAAGIVVCADAHRRAVRPRQIQSVWCNLSPLAGATSLDAGVRALHPHFECERILRIYAQLPARQNGSLRPQQHVAGYAFLHPR
ncbi:MAG: carboxypeptidase-like regulatory domain-containing protein [Calditrichia bacterium]